MPLISQAAILLIVGAVVSANHANIFTAATALVIPVVMLHNLCGYALGFGFSKILGLEEPHDTLREVFELNGFIGIETRAVEQGSSLLKKGETSKDFRDLRFGLAKSAGILRIVGCAVADGYGRTLIRVMKKSIITIRQAIW